MTGADGFSWKNYDFSYKNSDGVEEFYKRSGSEIAYAPLSAKMFPSQLKTDKEDIWTSSDRTTEYKNANDMWGYIVSQFKQYAYKQITYTVTPSSTLVNQLVGDGRPLQKGDTVIIQDDNYMDIDGNVGLILSARVSEIITSDTNPANNKIVFSNYKKLKSEASSDIKAIVSQLVNDATPYFADIATSNGVQFKNGTGSTTLSAHIFKGSATTETIADSYEWSKDGTVVAPTQTITVDASGVADKAVYSFKATVGGKVVASQSVTTTNVNDGAKGAQGPQGPQGLKGDPGATGIPGQPGADGKTSYLHIAYATNSTGTAGFDVSNATGKTYIGQYTDFTSADSTDPSKYTWSLIKGDKGDTGERGLQGEKGEQGIPGSKGADGKTQYTHIAYANSSDGVSSFSTSDSNRTYIGMYVDFIINDSTTPSDYSWTLVKGADGTQGTPGKAGADGKTPYFHTAWAYSADGTDGFTTVYPNLNLLTDSKDFINKDLSGNNQKTSIVSPNSTVLKDGNDTYLNFISTGDNQYWLDAYLVSDWSTTPPPGFTNVNILPNSKYTFSFWAKGTGKHTVTSFDNWTIPSNAVFDFTLTNEWKHYSFTVTSSATIPVKNVEFFLRSIATGTEINLKYPKVEPGSIATPHMPSASEVTTADWPSYIGQYTDFTQADSTNPSAYTWSLIRGNDGKDGADGKDGIAGKDGVGINSTTVTYAISSSGTTAPTTGWSTTVPTVEAGSYLWTKTVWAYTDNTSETGYSVAKMGNDGSNGDPGKIVSDTEPTTRFKGLTWKYSGTADLTASDGTVIKQNTEYYYNGTHWMINYLSANNIEANSITADLIDAKNLTITDGEFVSTITDGTVQIQTEIKDDHLLIYKMDTSHNDITTIALKSDSGLGMTYQNSDTSQYTSSGINLQGIFTQDNILKNGVSLTPGGVKFTQNGASAGLNFDGTNLSSSMPIQAPNTIVKSTYFSVSGIGIRLDRMMSFVAVTFSGQASSTINTTPTINNVLPVGFRPISPYSIDYMIPLNTANNGYIYFNPDGSIRIMATINSGYYIRGTRLYITNDVYPS